MLDLDYLDLVFDCHEIDKLDAIKDNSIDVITLTNVLHHLKSPIAFLNHAASKLKSGGKVIATEPFFSVLSTPIFKHLHHEPVDFRISEPELDKVQGPLASANIALPWLIFFRRREWLQRLNENFDVAALSTRPFSGLSYMATGGISRTLPIPHFVYRPVIFGGSRHESPLSGFLRSFFYGSPDTTLMSIGKERNGLLACYSLFLSNTKRPRRSTNT